MRQQRAHERTSEQAPVRSLGGDHWVVVADQNKAHVYKRTPKGLERLAETQACSCAFPEDGAGREDVFLRELALWLKAAEREAAFERLVLVAPPDARDELCAHLGARVNTRLCKALARDIEQITDDEAEDHLAEVMWH